MVLIAVLFALAFAWGIYELGLWLEDRRERQERERNPAVEERDAERHARPLGNVLVLRRMSESEDDAP